MWLKGDSMESIMLDDTPSVSSPHQARQMPCSPRVHAHDGQQRAELGLFANKVPEVSLTPRMSWWPKPFQPEGVSSAPAVPDSQADKESSVVRALSARLPAFANLFSARCTGMPLASPWNQERSVVLN